MSNILISMKGVTLRQNLHEAGKLNNYIKSLVDNSAQTLAGPAHGSIVRLLANANFLDCKTLSLPTTTEPD